MQYIVPIISGKGGVGKSTVAANLAVSLAALGYKTALLDCDLYGPSIPTLFGGGAISPDHEGKIIPAEKFGVKYISIGFFLHNPDDPVIWRGPMFNKAINQLFNDVSWGVVDICIVDMPPGTGDAQLSLAQSLKLTGALAVTTPQEVALADVRKSLNMLKKVNVPVLGLIENMAGFKLPNGETVNIFGEGGGKKTADDFGIEFFGSIPLVADIREGGDNGNPIATDHNSDSAKIFRTFAERLVNILKESENQGPVIVNS